jgi:hypothetical protein
MATKLEKDIVRETTIEVDGKILLVTLTKNQTIKIREKGRGKDIQEVEIGIEQLFTQLLTQGTAANEDTAMISLTDFRSQYLIQTKERIPLDVKVILEQITTRLLRGI